MGPTRLKGMEIMVVLIKHLTGKGKCPPVICELTAPRPPNPICLHIIPVFLFFVSLIQPPVFAEEPVKVEPAAVQTLMPPTVCVGGAHQPPAATVLPVDFVLSIIGAAFPAASPWQPVKKEERCMPTCRQKGWRGSSGAVAAGGADVARKQSPGGHVCHSFSRLTTGKTRAFQPPTSRVYTLKPPVGGPDHRSSLKIQKCKKEIYS